MKIGIIVSFYDFRADVRDLIKVLQTRGFQVILFFRESEEKEILRHAIEGLEYRKINEQKRGLRNRLLEYAFLIFKRLPISRHNYFLMELFKISNGTGDNRLLRMILFIQKLGLNVVSYDFLLKHIGYSGKTRIDDVTHFIGFTEFQSDHFAARLLNENKSLQIYVYSWDHPCKHTRFSKKIKYLVWSEAIKQDLINLQGVPGQNVRICGSTQFTYLHDYLRETSGKPAVKENYIYYCCAIGIRKLIPFEVEIMKSIAGKLAEIRPDWKLLVRPYPLLNDWNLYSPLIAASNVEMDDAYRRTPFADFKAASYDKFNKIKGSRLLLHSGSTIGLEACLLGTPSLLVDFGYGKNRSGLSVYGFIHQFQNEKYLLNEGLGLKSPESLAAFLDDSEKKMEAANSRISSNFEVLSMPEFVDNVLREFGIEG